MPISYSPTSAQVSQALHHHELQLLLDTMRFSFFLALVVATFAVTYFNDASAKEAVEIKTFTEMWKNTLPKVKAKAAAAKASAVARKNWDDVTTKLQAGGKLKTLDTSKKEWQTAFTKAEQAGQLHGASKEQVVKVTEDAAQAMAKNPSKWRYVKKALEITFGAVLTALIVVGLNSMFS